MCGTSPTDDLSVIRDARSAADHLLSGLGVPIQKALDVSNPRGFDTAVSRLASELRARAGQLETTAVRESLARLDIDWSPLTAAARTAVIRRVVEAARRALTPIHTNIQLLLGRAASQVVESTRAHARRTGLAISADFNAIDRRAIDYVTRANSLFVRDEYGRRIEALGLEARRVVARGLEQGLGRAQLAEDLAAAAGASLTRRSQSYWEIIAASFVGESRSLSQLSAYAEAGISRYVISSVLDEHTTDTCRFLDGKVIRTDDGLRAFDRLETSDDPLAIKQVRPWVRERSGEDGKRVLVFDRAGERSVLAVVERSGVGVRDDRGTYSQALSGRELAPAGIGFPPFHGLCRSSTIPHV